MAVEIDGVLKEWGDILYRVKRKARPAPVSIAGGKRTSSNSAPKPKPMTGGQMKANLARAVRKVPEVMVKITTGRKDPDTGKRRILCTNMQQIKAHFEYLSRVTDPKKENVPLEDEHGHLIDGPEAIARLRDDWQYSGGYSIPASGGSKREAFSIVLSMPPGTDRASVKDAAREFAREHFSDHQYAFAAHEDEDHPHVHLCVRSVSHSLVRLNPRKADLQQWRESFAGHLRQHGIEANATPRDLRGRVFKGERQAVRHLHKRRASKVKQAQARDVKIDAARTVPIEHASEQKIRARRGKVVQGMRAMATALAISPDMEERKLALDVASFTAKLPAAKTAHRVAVDRIKEGEGNSRGKGRPAQEQGKALDQDKGRDK